MPTAFRNGSIPLPPVTPFGQGGGGLVWWNRGDSLITSSAGRLLTWGNKASPSFNVQLASTDIALAPFVGLDTVDGHPATTWPDDLGTTEIHVLFSDGATGVHLKDRNGVNFGYGPGETQTLTWFAVVVPWRSTNVTELIGGTIFRLGTTATGGQLDLELIFRGLTAALPPIAANSLTVMSNDWTDDFANAIYAPPTPIATYRDKLLLLHYETGGRADNKLWLSGAGFGTMVPIALAPGALPAVSGHAAHTQSSYGTVDNIYPPPPNADRWVGLRPEDCCMDFKVSTNAAALTHTYGYFAAEYPSMGIVVP